MPLKTPEERKEYNRKYREKHLKEIQEYDRMRYKRDKEKRDKLNKKTYLKKRDEYLEYKKNWLKNNTLRLKIARQELKQKLINMKGGKCEICGWSGHQSAFDFHHIDPKTREWQNGRGGEWILKKYRGPEALIEVKLLCANCHRILHHGG